MTRPDGGYATEEDGVRDILDDEHASHHHDRAGLDACITLAGGRKSMILERLHGNVAPDPDFGW